MVPSGWSIEKFSDVAELIHGFQFREQHFTESGIPVAKISSLVHFGGIDLSTCSFVSESQLQEFYKYRIEAGDILMALTGGTLGKTCRVQKNIGLCFQNYRVGKFKPNPKFLDKDYLYFILISHTIQKKIEDRVNEAAQPNIGKADFDKIQILLPSIPDQKKIAKILLTWDQAISATEKLLENSEKQKKALMQQLFVEKKYFNGAAFVFQKKRFSEVVKIDERSLGAKTPDNFEFDYISLSDVSLGKISPKLKKFVYKDAPSRARRLVQSGDILLSTVRPNLQGFAKISHEYESCVVSTGFSVLTPKDGFCGDYLYHYLFSTHITGQIKALVVGSNYPAINSSDVSKLSIFCPEYEDQLKIAKILNNCDCTIKVLQKKLDYLKQEKKALMQQLLTGKKRVKVVA